MTEAADDMPPTEADPATTTTVISHETGEVVPTYQTAAEAGDAAIAEAAGVDPPVAPGDRHPLLSSVTNAEFEAAEALMHALGVVAMKPSATVGGLLSRIEIIAQHMRLAVTRVDAERHAAVFAAPIGEGQVMGPSCHPGATWHRERDDHGMANRVVCSICRQPAPGAERSGQVSFNTLSGVAAAIEQPTALELGSEIRRLGLTGDKVEVQGMTGDVTVPACHPFSYWISKGDGTAVCAHCGKPTA